MGQNTSQALDTEYDLLKSLADKKTDFRIGTDYKIQALGQYTLKVGSGMSLNSSGEASFASSANASAKYAGAS